MIKYKTIVILALSLFLLFCGKTKNPVTNTPAFRVESSQSSCKNISLGKIGVAGGADSLIFSSHGDTICMFHQNAFYNCCLKIKVNVARTPHGFDLFEYETGDPCNCTCYFDIITLISGLSNGTYLIRVFDTGGNLAGSEVVDIPHKYGGSESVQSQCKSHYSSTATESISDDIPDSVLVWFYADTIWVMHKNDYENCASIIKTRIERTLEGFDLYEYDITTMWATCACYFDVSTTIFGVTPGTYLIRVFDTDSSLVDSAVVDIPPYAGFESSQSKCKGSAYRTDAKPAPDSFEDSVLVRAYADTVWVTHKHASYNCCSSITTKLKRTPEGFNLYEYDIAILGCRCMCDFDITTTIYGVSPGVYVIRVFDTAGDLVGEVDLVIPPK